MKRGENQGDGLKTLAIVQHVVSMSSDLFIELLETVLFPTNTPHNNVHSTTLVRTFFRIGMRAEGKGS